MKKETRNRLAYIWMYYKVQIFAAAVVLFLAGYFLITARTQKETILSVQMIDCHTETEAEEMETDFLKAAGIDEKQYHVDIQNQLMFQDAGSANYAMTSLSRFLADIGSEKLDVCGLLMEDFLKYDKADTYMDLRSCFSEEELGLLGDKLVTAEDGRVIGLYADELPIIKKYECYEAEDTRAAVGIVYNTPHKEIAARYLLYLAGIV